jgi:hypothetical protein
VRVPDPRTLAEESLGRRRLYEEGVPE